MKATSESGESESESESESEQTKTRVASKPAPEAARQQQQQQQPPQQQRAEEDDEEEEEESETDSDEETGGTRYDSKKDGFPGAKGGAAVEQAAAKRGRDVNGMVDEPGGKRRKDSKDEKARGQQPAKSASPVKPVKVARPKADKARVVGAAAKVESAKTGASRKRKTSPVPANSLRQAAKKGEADKTSPSKVKKAAAHWSSKLEQSLATLMYRDKSTGFAIPISRLDAYWEKLLKRLPLEGDITELQLVDKVKRMRSRYHFLDKKFKEEGAPSFKSAHEEQMFQTWEGIWGSGMETAAARAGASQPAAEEEESDDESEDTASPAKGAMGQSSEEDEDGEDGAENTKGRTAGLNQVGSAGKHNRDQVVVTPFVSKPRLEFTPRISRDDPRKGSRKTEDVIGGDHRGGAPSAGDDGRHRDVNSLVSEHFRQLRAETLAFFQEIRGSYFPFVEDIPGFGNLMGGLGGLSLGKGLGNSTMEKLVGGGGNEAANRLQKKWREHKVKELALFSERLQLLQEQCRLQQEELKLQNHS